jgi:hypothetical protein
VEEGEGGEAARAQKRKSKRAAAMNGENNLFIFMAGKQVRFLRSQLFSRILQYYLKCHGIERVRFLRSQF